MNQFNFVARKQELKKNNFAGKTQEVEKKIMCSKQGLTKADPYIQYRWNYLM
jgi:hypothetical protein